MLAQKNAVIEKFEPKDILAELDGLLSYCQENGVDRLVVSDINIRTQNNVKKCNKQKPRRNIQMIKKYLLAIPFYKGISIYMYYEARDI